MNDLISRQAAIKYLMTNMNWYDEDGYESDDDYKRECITELINGVPSAQPYTKAELQKIQELEQAELEKAFELGKAEANKWIPCDKGEPDEDTECWVTVKTTDTLYRGNFTKRYGERRNKGFITSDGFMWWNTALAWMPIYEPKPYKAESEKQHE